MVDEAYADFAWPFARIDTPASSSRATGRCRACSATSPVIRRSSVTATPTAAIPSRRMPPRRCGLGRSAAVRTLRWPLFVHARRKARLMFTGIIEGLGRLARSSRAAAMCACASTSARCHSPRVQLGESIAVNGVCLTVVEFDARRFDADASNETLALTTLGALPVGARGQPRTRDAPDRSPRRPPGQRPRRWPRPRACTSTTRAPSAGLSPRRRRCCATSPRRARSASMASA